ncbi:hypothetical protein J437_LFUL018845 [Ladona fulva]|uniref:Uncharacterized protein n=1 Tax=Ladona fulva TaxID=123851 RepID=A0A8K0KTD6_LADFU|nr:hypothetical protein J437_LFUL018845 [Ladona fulva]
MEGGGGSEFDSDAANTTTFLEMGSIERDTSRDANSEENCVSSTEMPSEKRIVGLSKNTISQGQQQQQGEQELSTKMLQIQSKRFYLDVKQNRRRRFTKVAEIGADGRRSQIFLALSTAAEFRDHLSMFSDFYASLGPPNPENVSADGKLKSEMMIKDNRRYYLDLKENSRGRFLRVGQVSHNEGGPRSQIVIPAQEMIEFRDALTDLLEKFGTDDGGFKGDLPERRHMRVENKNFYFDIGQNNRGIYMRISESTAVYGNKSKNLSEKGRGERIRSLIPDLTHHFEYENNSSFKNTILVHVKSSLLTQLFTTDTFHAIANATE